MQGLCPHLHTRVFVLVSQKVGFQPISDCRSSATPGKSRAAPSLVGDRSETEFSGIWELLSGVADNREGNSDVISRKVKLWTDKPTKKTLKKNPLHTLCKHHAQAPTWAHNLLTGPWPEPTRTYHSLTSLDASSCTALQHSHGVRVGRLEQGGLAVTDKKAASSCVASRTSPPVVSGPDPCGFA